MALTKEDKLFLKKFGLKVRQLRESKGWTLEETEEHGWPSWKHLQRIESGNKNITILTLERLRRLYRISVDELFK